MRSVRFLSLVECRWQVREREVSSMRELNDLVSPFSFLFSSFPSYFTYMTYTITNTNMQKIKKNEQKIIS